MFLRRICHSLPIFVCLFGIQNGVSQDAPSRPEPYIIESPTAASANIEDITVEASLLQREDFRPQGEELSLGLQDAIDIAVKENPDMRIARLSLQQSLYDLDLTESDYRNKFALDSQLQGTLRKRASGTYRIDPEKGLISDTKREYENDTLFNIGPRYTRTFQNGSDLSIEPKFEYEYYSDGAFDSGVTNPKGNHYEDRYSLSLGYDFPINSRPRDQIRTQIENARISTIQSDYSLFSRGKSTEDTVINRYWNIKQLQERVNIQRERLLLSRRVAFIIQTQFEFENVAKQDVGQAQTDVLNNEASLIELEGNVRNSMETLSIFLGIPIATNIKLKDELDVTPLPLSGSEYVSMVTDTNLDLKSQRLTIRRLENSLQVARLGQQPDLVLSSYANQDDEGEQNLGMGLIFSWQFSDGGATRARVRSLEENLEQTKIRLWDAERQLIQETYGDLRELQLQLQRIEILQRNVDQANYNLENGLINFREFGRISFRDLQDFQIDLANARANLVQAKVFYNTAKSSLLSKVHNYEPTSEIEPLLTKIR